jgi:hypothetical protein
LANKRSLLNARTNAHPPKIAAPDLQKTLAASSIARGQAASRITCKEGIPIAPVLQMGLRGRFNLDRGYLAMNQSVRLEKILEPLRALKKKKT